MRQERRKYFLSKSAQAVMPPKYHNRSPCFSSKDIDKPQDAITWNH